MAAFFSVVISALLVAHHEVIQAEMTMALVYINGMKQINAINQRFGDFECLN